MAGNVTGSGNRQPKWADVRRGNRLMLRAERMAGKDESEEAFVHDCQVLNENGIASSAEFGRMGEAERAYCMVASKVEQKEASCESFGIFLRR